MWRCGFIFLFVTLAQLSGQSREEAANGVLNRNCASCHGAAAMSGLDLRTRESALKGGKRGAALVPGKPEQSLLLKAMERSGDLKMPPGKQGLTAGEVRLVSEWIRAGAAWSQTAGQESTWWSFRKLQSVKPPATGHPIDAFLSAALTARKLKPNPAADRRTLIRRAYFDLAGLPPSPEQVNAFVSDPSPDAWPKLIDSLLASPRYGERWGRHWLDVVRYADTGGFETDIFFPNAWRYRDYVIKSFNEDKPFDRFVKEQIAGDEIWPDNLDLAGGFEIPKEKLAHLDARIGTAMYTIGPVYHEAALNGDQLRYEWLTDAVDVTGEAFLGLTLGCSRCHDHKFDPLTSRDYHGMMAIFAGSEEKEIPVIHKMNLFGIKSSYPSQLKVDDLKAAIQRIDRAARKRAEDGVRSQFDKATLDAFDKPPAKRSAAEQQLAARVELALTTAGLQENATGKVYEPEFTQKEIEDKERLYRELGHAAFQAPGAVPTATTLGHADVVPDVFLTARGDYRSKGDKIRPGFPAVLAAGAEIREPENQPLRLQRRKALAEWLASPGHPLTARVIANRVWHWHFGRGIVGTPNDFGRQGEAPTHPELLDWLAAELQSRNWSLKQLHRLIMTSEAYMRSSAPSESNSTVDANNRYLWRWNRTRLDAETLRDAVLQTSGSLNLAMGGRAVIPPLSKEEESSLWARNQWPVSLDPAEHSRRSVYLYVKRSFPFPMFTNFDSPDTSVSCARRDQTTVAPQALQLLNSGFMLGEARKLAKKLEPLGALDARVEGLWREVLQRPPSADEVTKARRFLSAQSVPEAEAFPRLCLVVLNTNEFLYVD